MIADKARERLLPASERMLVATRVVDENPPLILVAGNGPVGVHFVNQLMQLGWTGHIKLFGEEENAPYNRVQLSAFLNQEISFQQLQNPVGISETVVEKRRCRIVLIDAENHQVLDQYGQWHHYDHLVLATGSRPHIPRIAGRDLAGVYRFRDLRDAHALLSRLTRSRHTVVIGGGLLGLETAKAMRRYSTQVTVIQHTPILMNRQLDEEASARIRRFAEDCGIGFRLNQRVKQIQGRQAVERIELNEGELLDCDTLIFATGISPNIDLAADAKLKVRLGIQIDTRLRTSAPDVYAIGECADYEGQVFGLVAPGLEQASVLAANLTGGHREYRGSTLVTELKVLGLAVFSMGKVGEEYAGQRNSTWVYRTETIYRRLYLHNGRLVGAIAIGEWEEVKSLQSALARQQRLWPWERLRFERSGQLFASGTADLSLMPGETIICNCQQVSLAQIRDAVQLGADFAALQHDLRAGTVCGTCKPLLQRLLALPVEKQTLAWGLLVSALCALIGAMLVLLTPALPYSDSVQRPGLDWLWTDGVARQVSGFTILGLTTFSLLLSARKRIRRLRWLQFHIWRNAHVILGVLALSILIAHTGISFGTGINRWLMLNFLLVVLAGVVSAVLSVMEGVMAGAHVKRMKRLLLLGHIVTFWPLPVLVSFHIVSVYYF